MKNEQVLQNVTAIAEKAQKAGLFSLQESVIVLETINYLTAILTEQKPVMEIAPDVETETETEPEKL